MLAERAESGLTAELARKGGAGPAPGGQTLGIERPHPWMNGYGKLRRRTGRNGEAVDCNLRLAAALATLRMPIGRATRRYRWDGGPTTRRPE